MSKLRLALIGAGAMGSNHARVASTSEDLELALVIDQDLRRATALAQNLGAQASDNPTAASDCDLAIVVTSTQTHYEVAKDLIVAGLPMLVEKPLAATLEQTRELLALADTNNSALMCGFVERYNPAITTAFSLVDESPLFIKAVRHSPPAPRITTSVISDLLIHDLDLAVQFAASPVAQHSGMTWAPQGSEVDEIAEAIVRFESGMLANVSANRTSQRKIRYFDIGMEHGLIQVDMLRRTVTVYKHVHHEVMGADSKSTYRAETVMDIPFVHHTGEPLALEHKKLVALVRGEADPATERATIAPAHELAYAIDAESKKTKS